MTRGYTLRPPTRTGNLRLSTESMRHGGVGHLSNQVTVGNLSSSLAGTDGLTPEPIAKELRHRIAKKCFLRCKTEAEGMEQGLLKEPKQL